MAMKEETNMTKITQIAVALTTIDGQQVSKVLCLTNDGEVLELKGDKLKFVASVEKSGVS